MIVDEWEMRPARFRGRPRQRKLLDLANDFDLRPEHLHNGGNDAAFTLEARCGRGQDACSVVARAMLPTCLRSHGAGALSISSFCTLSNPVRQQLGTTKKQNTVGPA